MLLYNITFNVSWPVCKEWLEWMQLEYIPEIMGTGHFERSQFVKLIEVDETAGPTYAIQLYLRNKDEYEAFFNNHSARFRDKVFARWGPECIAFRSLMEVIN